MSRLSPSDGPVGPVAAGDLGRLLYRCARLIRVTPAGLYVRVPVREQSDDRTVTNGGRQ